MARSVKVVFWLLLCSFALTAQSKIAPALNTALNNAMEDDAPVKALIVLEDQFDIRALDTQLYAEEALLGERAYRVITALQDKAASTQGPLLDYLASKSSDEVLSYEPFWVSNMIAVEARPSVIMEMSTRNDIGYLQIDAELEWDKPVDRQPTDNVPNGVEPGIRAINAHLMWQAGFTGEGVIVMGVDTGVDPNHPAIGWKWRGNSVPAAQAWIDPGGGSTTPNDCDNHGTHTIGTMQGLDPATNDTIGVAFGSEWIAAKTICSGNHTSRSIAAFQWAMDPDGDPGTHDDMPVGIGNSWWDPSINASTQCDPAQNPYIAVVQAVEASGIGIVFSAGNSGPGGTSITQPKNVNFDLVNFWATGAVDGNNPSLPIAGFSSRGPVVASCLTGDPSLDIKPEASAPGVNVRSAIIGGGYSNFSGTSMAAPHVVGALALLREAHPNRTGSELKMALYLTATDLGAPGEDNDYGMGVIDVWAAHQSLADPEDPEPPTDVTAYSDFNTPTSVQLDWTDPTNYVSGDTLLNFTIEIYRDGANVASVAAGTGTYTDGGLTDGQTYAYEVMSKDTNDSLSNSVNLSATAGGAATPAAPTDLSVAATTSDATLSWTDPTTQEDGTPLDDLDHINVYRDGTMIASVSPGTESYVDTPPPGFVYRYTVTAVDNESPANESDPSNEVGSFVGDVPSFLIWVGPDVVGPGAESGDSIMAALAANGKGAFLTNDLFEFGTDLSVYQAIFVVLGIFGDNHTIGAGDAEGPALDAFLSGGGNLYVEGGDCFNYDPEQGGYQIRPWFDLDDGPDGSGDLAGVVGLNDLSAFSFAYNGANNWMDELAPLGSTPIWQNNANADISGVTYSGYNGGGTAVGVVPSFGGFVDNPTAINESMRALAASDVERNAASDGFKIRPERGERQPFVKKAVPATSIESPLAQRDILKYRANGSLEIAANTKDEVMFAYLTLMSLGGPGDSPNPPSDFVAYSDFNTPTSMSLTWTDPSEYINGDPLTDFGVVVARDGVVLDTVDMGVESYTDNGLTDGESYMYEAWAVDADDSTSSKVDASWTAGGAATPSAPSDLAGDGNATEAILTWTDPTTQVDGTPLDDLDGINIYRDGQLIATAAAGDETYTDTPPADFTYNYTVTAVDNENPVNESAESNSISVFVGDTPGFLVWVGPDAVGPGAESGDSLFAALVANGEGALLTNDLFEFGSDLNAFDGIFVVLGIFGDNHVLGVDSPEAAALEDYMVNGGRLYIEGGDCFNFDPDATGTPGYNIRPWFDVDDGPDGNGDVAGIVGQNDLSAFSFAYVGANNWMDELQPIGSTPIWKNDANDDISGVFNVGYNGGSARAIGIVPSFGGLVDAAVRPLNPGTNELLASDVVRNPFTHVEKERPERTVAAAPFVKKAAHYPELKATQKSFDELIKINPDGSIEMLANTKVDLMAAYLNLFRTTGDPAIGVDPTALADTLLVGGTATHTIGISNTGGTLAGDVTFSITENPAADWISVDPTSGTVTANNTVDVSVNLDATGLTAGPYSTTLEIASNDTTNPLIVVTVDMQVNDAPVLSISPSSFDLTMGPDSIAVETLSITNSGAGPLEFMVTIEGAAAANAKVDMIAGGKALNAGIVSTGKPMSLDRLTEYQSHIPVGPQSIDQNEVSQKGPELTHIGTMNKGALAEEVFGSAQNAFGPLGTRGRGNLFTCTSSTIITEHRLYLNVTTATDLYFVIAESETQAGNYAVISVANASPSGTGEGWYSSGPINAVMEAGKYYLIFAQWEAGANYYNEQNIAPYPIQASFGELTAGAGWSTGSVPGYAVPPVNLHPIAATAFADPVAYYQTIVTGGSSSWLTVDPTEGTVPAGSSVDVSVIFNSAGLLGGDYNSNIIVSSNDPANPADTAHAHLFVEGEVGIALSPDPMVFPATFSPDTLLLNVANTGNGQLSVTDVASDNSVFVPQATAFDVPPFDTVKVPIVYLPGTAGVDTGTLTVSSNDPNNPTASVGVEGEAVDPPAMSVDPTSISHGLTAVGDSADIPVVITNNGGAPLEWSAAMNLFGTQPVENTEPVVMTSATDRSEGATYYENPIVEALGDTLFSFNATAVTPTPDIAILGMEFALGHFWLTGRDPNGGEDHKLYKVSADGSTLVEFWSQNTSSVWGWRDMAFDGTYLYASDSPTVQQIDPATGQATGVVINGPENPNRGLAYDPATDHFWTANFSGDIYEFDRAGNVINQFSNALSIYGLAWDDQSEGGPFLWAWSQDGPVGGPLVTATQIDPTTGAPTGVFFTGVEMNGDPADDDIAGGATISGDIVPGKLTLAGVQQSNINPGDGTDFVVVYEMQDLAPPWMEIVGPTSGVINPGDQDGFIVRLHAIDPDTTYNGSINIASNDPAMSSMTMPVSLSVSVVGIGDDLAMPTTYEVSRNYPNPFNPTTTIKYQLPQVSDVRLVIYNVLGQRVRTLVAQQQAAGRYEVQWDATNSAGDPVGSGIYIYRFEAGDYQKVQKMILLK